MLLATTLLKDQERAWDNHVLVCNFAKYSPVLKNFHRHCRLLYVERRCVVCFGRVTWSACWGPARCRWRPSSGCRSATTRRSRCRTSRRAKSSTPTSPHATSSSPGRCPSASRRSRRLAAPTPATTASWPAVGWCRCAGWRPSLPSPPPTPPPRTSGRTPSWSPRWAVVVMRVWRAVPHLYRPRTSYCSGNESNATRSCLSVRLMHP